MNTKWFMTATAVLLGVSGIVLTFAPDYIVSTLGMEASQVSTLLAQLIGGLYFGFAMLNWMTKESLIGGIYNRPVAVSNFTHFMIVGLALANASFSKPELPILLLIASAVYVLFAILFGIMLFQHPIPEK